MRLALLGSTLLCVAALVLACMPRTGWGDWTTAEIENKVGGADPVETEHFTIYDDDPIWDDEIGEGYAYGTVTETTGLAGTCTAAVLGKGTITSSAGEEPIVNGVSTLSYSATSTAAASYDYQLHHKWVGCLPREERTVVLDAAGGGQQQFTATCSVDPGVTASATCSGSGSCGSLEPCDADLQMPERGVHVRYNTVEASLEMKGDIGESVTVTEEQSQTDFAYSYKAYLNWNLFEGAGAHTGSSSYTVKSTVKYNDDTDAEYICAYEGDALAEGACAWEWGIPDYSSSVEFSASAAVDLRIPEGD
jgi:hypothetical protein